MKHIAVAGATGALGGRIVDFLIARGASVRALVRETSATEKVADLQRRGVTIVPVDLGDVARVAKAIEGTECVVSALQGLSDVIVDGQTTLLHASLTAKVERFIPSDFASDLSKLPPGENRNIDLRRTFFERLDAAPIQSTSIRNGAFAEILRYGTPLLNHEAKRVAYWESPDWRVDFTASEDIAAFTACAALDPAAPKILRIAGFQISATELVDVVRDVTSASYELVRMGSREDLLAHNRRERAAHPEGETDLYPAWQRSQYMHSMFTAQSAPLDNARYPELTWKSAREFVAPMSRRKA